MPDLDPHTYASHTYASHTYDPDTYDRLWDALAPIGRHPATGGYRRYTFGAADAELRDWFHRAAADAGLSVETDGNGTMWAWWGAPGPDAVVTGSHLDSVPDGGAYDGPLGVVSALAAVAELRRRGAEPRRPLAVAVFPEEEGARFGVPCLGSRLLTGAVTAERAAGLTDQGGTTWARAMEDAGLDPARMGADPERLARIRCFVELHVEQGRALADRGRAVGAARSIWPHGRWRWTFTGRADHAGTTRLEDRRDPMLPMARMVLAARAAAAEHGAVATVGRVEAEPNGTNAIASRVQAWLDARAPGEPSLRAVVSDVAAEVRRAAEEQGVTAEERQESDTPVVEFDGGLRDRVAAAAGGGAGPVPVLPTGAGHDAGVLAGSVPTAMLFVRNPTGVSHSPEEHAERPDCHAGVAALADVLQDLLEEEG